MKALSGDPDPQRPPTPPARTSSSGSSTAPAASPTLGECLCRLWVLRTDGRGRRVRLCRESVSTRLGLSAAGLRLEGPSGRFSNFVCGACKRVFHELHSRCMRPVTVAPRRVAWVGRESVLTGRVHELGFEGQF